MEIIFDVVIPVFVVILCGWSSCKYWGLPRESVDILNQYVLRFAVPPMLFLATANASINDLVNPLFIAAFFLSSLITMFIGVFCYRGMKSKGVIDATVLALICGWGNTIYMGVPLAFYMFGEKGTIAVVVATLTTNMVFILWLSFFSNLKKSGNHFQKIWSTFIGMFCKSPVLIAPVIGGIFSYYSLSIPTPIYNLFSMLAPSAAPVALFAMGASLVGLNLKGEKKQLVWVSIVKVIVNPLIALGVVLFLGLEPYWAASVILLSALPTGTMVFIFAKQHDKRVSLASSGIMLTTILSLFSLAIILPLLQAWVK